MVMVMLVRALAASFVGLVAVLFALQRRLIWPRPSEVADPRKHGAQLLEIPAELYGGSRKQKVAAAFFPARDSLAPVFVFFHGKVASSPEAAPLDVLDDLPVERTSPSAAVNLQATPIRLEAGRCS